MSSSPAPKQKKSPNEQETTIKTVKSNWGDVSNVNMVFADNLFLQVINDQFYLTFGQMVVPLGFDPMSEGSVELRPVARLVVPPGAMKQMMTLLNQLVPKHIDMGE